MKFGIADKFYVKLNHYKLHVEPYRMDLVENIVIVRLMTSEADAI
jgi:hypothetical protein